MTLFNNEGLNMEKQIISALEEGGAARGEVEGVGP